jgi:hypothetical protein
MFLGSSENLAAALLAIPMELERVRTSLEAGLAESHAGTRLEGARYLPVDRKLAWGGKGRLVGWSVRTVDAPVTVILRNGRDEGSEPIAVIDLGPDQAQTIWLGPTGVFFGEALYLDRTGGDLQGAVWIGAVD